jgi:hypothetical protein
MCDVPSRGPAQPGVRSEAAQRIGIVHEIGFRDQRFGVQAAPMLMVLRQEQVVRRLN